MKNIKEKTQKTAAKYGLYLLEDTMKVESMGLDFEVVFAADREGQEWVCRMPRRKDVYDKIIREKRYLDFISTHQSVFQVPVWEIANEELIAYEKLNGVPAVTTDPNTQETDWVFDSSAVPESYLNSLSRALASLHSLPLKEAREAGFKVQTAEGVRESMKRRMLAVKNQFEVNETLWNKWQTWVNNKEIWPERTGIVHGDLFPGHTVIDEMYQVTGIIDWTESEGSDTSIDFTAVYMLFGEEALDTLLEGYQNAGGYTWPRMKEHIIERLSTQAITIAEFAQSSGLKDYRKLAEDMFKMEPDS